MPFSTTDTEEGALNGHDSTTDAAKDIETQALSIPDAAGSLGALPFSAAKGRWGVRSPRGPDPPTDDGHDSTDTGNDFIDTGNDFADAENHFTAQPSNFSADRHPPAAVGTALAAEEWRPLRTLTEKHPYLNPSFHEPHPLLRLHPPSFGGFGRTFRVQSAQPPFGRSFLGRCVDIRPACTVGSRPLRPRLTRCCAAHGRGRPEHPDRECTTSANAIRPPSDEPEHGTDGHQTERNAPEHTADGRKRHDSAPERSANEPEHTADAPEHDAQCAKNADFIDVDPVRGHKIDHNESEHCADAGEHTADGRKRHDSAPEHAANAAERSANAVSTPADEPEHGAQRAKIADFIDVDPARGHKIERNKSEHADDERKRHDPVPEHTVDGHKIDRNAPEYPADECPDPAYDPDAGQRVLRSAAHRRAVRAEREACCGALRHLAHCCVAF